MERGGGRRARFWGRIGKGGGVEGLRVGGGEEEEGRKRKRKETG